MYIEYYEPQDYRFNYQPVNYSSNDDRFGLGLGFGFGGFPFGYGFGRWGFPYGYGFPFGGWGYRRWGYPYWRRHRRWHHW